MLSINIKCNIYKLRLQEDMASYEMRKRMPPLKSTREVPEFDAKPPLSYTIFLLNGVTHFQTPQTLSENVGTSGCLIRKA